MGLNRSPDILLCNGQKYGLEDWVKTLDTNALTSLYGLEDWVKTLDTNALTSLY